ncbi:uncharacterized protein DFL_005042 [Arthrobotrys flagrans]|uniref:Uncharacterized protein n=1 Tax=Arthrobotrys flagrans TaxID=97331 RepID=A0A437A6F8_ARTFL|nr:hypothetical protein DFL_005042 [Arthrobotrys flagrans]
MFCRGLSYITIDKVSLVGLKPQQHKLRDKIQHTTHQQHVNRVKFTHHQDYCATSDPLRAPIRKETNRFLPEELSMAQYHEFAEFCPARLLRSYEFSNHQHGHTISTRDHQHASVLYLE